MKKLLSLLFSILLVSCLAFSVTACGDAEESKSGSTEAIAPITYNFKLEEDDDGNKTYTLTDFTLSEEAKEFVDDEDWDGLAKLFNRKVSTEIKGEKTYSSASVRILELPDQWGKEGERYPVTKIAESALANQVFIKELIVPASVVEIELGAFSGLSSLEKITLPFIGSKLGAKNNAKLFGYVFGTIGGTNLTSITQTYNDGSENNTTAFYIPSSLRTVVITGKVGATAGEVYSYYISDDNEMIVVDEEHPAPAGKEDEVFTTEGDDRFLCYDESALQPYAFHSVSMIETVIFEGEITAIPEYAFYGCGFKSLDFTDSGIVEIGKNAYANCTSLKYVTFGTVTAIKDNAFNGCTVLGENTKTTVNVLDLSLVTEIGEGAFVGTSADEDSVVFHADVTEDDKKSAFGEDFIADEE